MIDKYDNKWIGTDEGGLVKMNHKNKWTIYKKFNTDLPSNVINDVAIDENGNVIGVLGIGHDVTQRMLREEKLKKYRARKKKIKKQR